MTYTVFVDDNFHRENESERYEYGEFDNLESAQAACRKIVDHFLLHSFEEGMTAQKLYEKYLASGEDPWISSPGKKCVEAFSAWDYAKSQCQVICSTAGTPTGLVPKGNISSS